jgi:peroxiredoxin
MEQKGPKSISTHDLFGGRRILLFSVPGAFTPTCSDDHLPGYLMKAEKILARGIDAIACVAVNDVFVMDAWGRARNVDGRILMLADGNGELARALGLELDATRFGMGRRSQRFAAVLQSNIVEILQVESEGGLKVSSADAMLAVL